MKIMSFNVLCWGGEGHSIDERMPLVVQRIRDEMPDILGVQEAHKQWMDRLCSDLPEYAFVGVARDDGKEQGEYSPVFYRTDRFSVSDSGTFWLSETPAEPSYGWGAACRRVCSYAVLTEKSSGKTFAAVNTHLDHISEQARVEGIKLIVEKLRTFGDMPIVCTGDFNTFEDSEAYRIMTQELMADSKYLAAVSDSGKTYHGFGLKDVEDSPIDFIFVRKDAVNVSSYRILRGKIKGKDPSDHYAVVSEITF